MYILYNVHRYMIKRIKEKYIIKWIKSKIENKMDKTDKIKYWYSGTRLVLIYDLKEGLEKQ